MEGVIRMNKRRVCAICGDTLNVLVEPCGGMATCWSGCVKHPYPCWYNALVGVGKKYGKLVRQSGKDVVFDMGECFLLVTMAYWSVYEKSKEKESDKNEVV